MSLTVKNMETATIIRRLLFLIILFALAIANLVTLFRGLNTPAAMEQAQIAREIARGNGFTTKSISPAAYHQAANHKKNTILFTKFQNTYHSPLNPLINAAVFKLIGADDSKKWVLEKDVRIYELDRVIATVSTIFFLMSIGVTYLLVTRIFDPKIAAVTAILMLFCETFWQFSLSGLPQMLMLFLFSSAIYFAYRALEDSYEGRIPFIPALLSGIFFTLLAMTHFLTVWIALGYVIFASIAFRPRGIIGIAILITLIIPSVYIILRNYSITGNLFGAAYFNLYNGIGGGIESFALRHANPPDLLDRGFFTTILRTVLVQTVDIIPFLAGIVIAPVFFLSMLHPFKRSSIASFRWAILLMFFVSAIGLSFFGISTNKLDPNQTHLLFAPIMTAYALAFISILWSRLPIVAYTLMLRNVHHIVIVLICTLPFIISVPSKIKTGMDIKNSGGIPHWPPYYAPALKNSLANIIPEDNICFSDQPWAVAWYTDRVSIWLPPTSEEFTELENIALRLDTPVHGILITPSSHGSANISSVIDQYKDFSSLVLTGKIIQVTLPQPISIFNIDPNIAEISKRYPYRTNPVGLDTIYYSSANLKVDSQE